MILVQEVTILPSGSVSFAVRGKKEWQNRLSRAFAVDGNTDNASHKCESSCIICPNVQNFCPKHSQPPIVGDATASPASPCRTLMYITKDFKLFGLNQGLQNFLSKGHISYIT